VDFGELMARLAAYREQEKIALETYKPPTSFTPAW
jgi:hypothetical protein